MSLVFAALISGDESAGYQAAVPDLPGCTASGRTVADTIGHVRNAVSNHLQSLADEGVDWPAPRSLAETKTGPGQALYLVDVQVDDAPVRVNISIGEQLLKRLDAAAEARGTTRSGFIATAVRTSLGERARAPSADFDAAARQIRDELSAFGRKLSGRLGPDSAFSRSMAELDDRVLETVRKAADSVSAAIARRRDSAANAAAAAAAADDEAKEETAGC